MTNIENISEHKLKIFLNELSNHVGYSSGPVTSVNQMASCGDYPIHWAAYWGRIEIVKLMVEQYHININIVGEFGNTPLDYAIESKNASMIDFIKSIGGQSGFEE
jgi:protoporphyrinogen oxidase